jgi:hypothetical protein
MLDSVTVAIIGTIFTFVTALVGSLISWRRGRSDDMAQFRADLFKMNESLRLELGSLRDRIRTLETEVHQKTLTILDLETHMAKIRRVILDKFGHDVDDLMDVDREDDHEPGKR